MTTQELWAVRDLIEDKIIAAYEDRATAEEMCLTFYEEAAYFTALDRYIWHHHWTMEKAAEVGWKYHFLDFEIECIVLWKF